MWAHQNRCVPIETFMGFSQTRFGLDRYLFSCSQIYPVQPSLLGFRINNIVVHRIGSRLMPISKKGFIPMFVCNSFAFVCSRRATCGAVVLSPSKNVIKRLGIVYRYFIELCERQVFDIPPSFSIIKCFINPCIRS